MPFKKVTIENALSHNYPLLVEEWHPTKNGKLTPNDITFGSHQKVWWRCKKNHEWEAVIKNRSSNNTQCPYCNNKKANDENSFAVKHPEIAKDWHPTKNNSLKPCDVLPGSHKKVWWQCPKFADHEWQAVVKQRVDGDGCSCCSGRTIVESNSLAKIHPELIKQWHLTKNGDLTPNSVAKKR